MDVAVEDGDPAIVNEASGSMDIPDGLEPTNGRRSPAHLPGYLTPFRLTRARVTEHRLRQIPKSSAIKGSR